MHAQRYLVRGYPVRAGLVASVLLLAGCQGIGPFGSGRDGDAPADSPVPATATRLVERDVEAPEVFQRSEQGLWAGTPSFGGVWVAHPAASTPERVLIRNEENGAFVIGSLFKRERDNPGPPFQISSDAAAALKVTAGQPTALNVTALRREEVRENDTADTAAEASADPVDTATLPETTITPAAATADTDSKPSVAPAADSRLPKPYVQIGIFSVEANADATAARLRSAGATPTVLAQDSNGRPFWRVIVGPARTVSERNSLIAQARTLGFADAYAVSD